MNNSTTSLHILWYSVFGSSITAGRGYSPLLPLSLFIKKDCVFLDAERLYDHITWETFQTRTLNIASNVKVRLLMCVSDVY